MTSPSQTAAQTFTDPADALVQDIALIMEHQGVVQTGGKTAQFITGEKGCLSIFSSLEMAADATDTERQERRWQTARLGVYLEKDGKKTLMFDAICTDRDALKHAHPASGLDKIPFVTGRCETGIWRHALNGYASSLRSLASITPLTHGPSPVRQRGPHWHSC